MNHRIPSSRTSRCAGIEIGVEELENLARAIHDGRAGVETLSMEERVGLAYQAVWKALQLQKRATRALRGERW